MLEATQVGSSAHSEALLRHVLSKRAWNRQKHTGDIWPEIERSASDAEKNYPSGIMICYGNMH